MPRRPPSAWSVDTTAPTTQIDSHPAALTDAAAANFGFSGTDAGGSGIGAFECRLDSNQPGAWASCTSPRELSGLGDGDHTFDVRATDAAGNTDPTPASAAWSIDTTAPQTQIDTHPPALTNSAAASFTFSGTDPGGSGLASFQCRLDSNQPADWQSCTSPKALSGLADGAHTFEVRAIDQAGNADASPDSFSWTVDTTAPQTQIDTHPAALVNVAAASFTFSGTDPGGSGLASFQCRLDSNQPGDWASCSSQRLRGLGDGSHTFEVRAVDNAGNAEDSPGLLQLDGDTTAPRPRSTPVRRRSPPRPRPASASRAPTPAARGSPPSSAAAMPKNGRGAARRATTPPSPTAPTPSRCGRSTRPATPIRARRRSAG